MNHILDTRIRKSHLVVIVLLCGMVLTACPSLISGSGGTTENQSTATWTVLHQNYTHAIFTDVAFLNETHGWVVGQWSDVGSGNGIILSTRDAGMTWETQLKNDTIYQEFSKVDVLNEVSVWVTAMGVLYHSTDCGVTWTTHVAHDGSSLMLFVKFIDEQHGWTATNDILYKTTDGGNNWTEVSGWSFDDTPRHLWFSAFNEVWAIGFFGIYHSTDLAETWTKVFDHGGWSLSMLDDGEGWAVSDGALMYTSNGTDWRGLPIPGYVPFRGFDLPYLSDVLFIENRGWIVGTEIPIMHTPDGGSTWYTQSTSRQVTSRMMALDFLNSTYGWAVGNGGVIMKTASGTDLGTRLWTGMTDPLFLVVIGGLVSVVVVVTGGITYRRRKRDTPHTVMIQ